MVCELYTNQAVTKKKSYETPSCLLLVSRGDRQKHKDRHIQIASLYRISPELMF